MNFKLITMFFLLIFGIYYSIPTLFNTNDGKKINLGLDLQGGMYLLLEANTNKIIEENLKSLSITLKEELNQKDILISNLLINKNILYFKIIDMQEYKNVEKILKNISKNILISKEHEKINITYTKEYIKILKNIALNKTINVIRNRLNQFGLSEPTVSKKGTNNILIEIPGIKDTKDEERAIKLISKTAKLEILEVLGSYYNKNKLNNVKIKNNEKIIDSKMNKEILKVNKLPILTGNMIIDANVGFDKSNKPVINFTLNSNGSKIFAKYTEKHIHKRTAIVLDNINYSAPYISSRIGGGHVQISGNYTLEEANDLVIALKSGSLEVPVKVLEKRMIGASLGEESIKNSLIALITGFTIVIIFMIIFYKISGLISVFALITNLFVIIAIMSLFNATLTLPGMAGIVLTVGMAIDANVIILERIKEYLKKGNTELQEAIEKGYDKAFSSILDANITTLIAAILLYSYGTGTIKGFALTMSIGILTSMITAIIGTKGIYDFINSKNITKNKKIML